jgi:UDP:flavonoid glycosyltransferase YjiC (YdhE family)
MQLEVALQERRAVKATILAPGSRGDVQPYIALGQGLQALGHDCTIVTTLDHEALVRSYGLGVVAVPVDVAAELRRVETNRAVEGGGVLASFRQFAEIAKRATHELARLGLEASRDADVVVTNFSTALVADALSKALRVPVVQAFNVPLTPTAAFPGALFPWLDFGGAGRRLGHHLTRAALWATARTSANDACVEVLGAKRAPFFPGPHAGLLAGPVVYGLSEAFLPRPADWPPEVQLTGFWFVEEPGTFTPPPELARFLDEGAPPVCIGFGSMSTENPKGVSELVLEAAAAAGVRLVLLAGWAGLEPGALSKDVLALGAVPHSWLYPRCQAVVHHGGAGTTAAAVRSGVPAVVVPFHGDQPFWASRVRALGVGPTPVRRKRLTATRLADAIRAAVTDEPMRERAAALGRLVGAEHGARRAATAIAALART